MAKILLIEDDAELAANILAWLNHQRYIVEVVSDGKEGYELLKLYEYDVVVVDWGLPTMTGVEICQSYRNNGGTKPILMLTGRDKTSEKSQGLDSGADDYLTKPFELEELSARIRALLRRAQSFQKPQLKIRDIVLEPSTFRVTKGGTTIALQPREFLILEFLAKHPNEVLSPEAILNAIWESDSESTISSIYTLIKTLRKKLGDSADIIKTVYGIGYRLEP